MVLLLQGTLKRIIKNGNYRNFESISLHSLGLWPCKSHGALHLAQPWSGVDSFTMRGNNCVDNSTSHLFLTQAQMLYNFIATGCLNKCLSPSFFHVQFILIGD